MSSAEVREPAMVCDDCHVTVDPVTTTGHRDGCTTNGRHQHHASLPIEQCLFYQEWQQRRQLAEAEIRQALADFETWDELPHRPANP